MLPRKNRLNHKEIVDLKKRGTKRLSSGGLYFTYVQNNEGSISKVSCSISKKIEKKAVNRNKIKRQCKEAVRLNLASLKKPVFGIVSFKKAYPPHSFNEICREVSGLFSRVE
ncbi:ribonuclease P protein component [Candidatus Kaiserbacteria bacterium CG10_big_fil_rev_8_21_14_0_10_43_70]|uniref:Ribonuclease P protein component n=1 Tax=Candidatus Kaiserbacteria bacterium CG10_big_fil_rev_8_21_14_0_10_43_70 TaxID=1974605 RepID=A0A2H0UJN0_9BACT|nr:MAG: ribonuclease P protein component [Candidatus Kaiserbacteria bacterium CG10_big_fil_rev_8_21_14_0_10_43_70]